MITLQLTEDEARLVWEHAILAESNIAKTIPTAERIGDAELVARIQRIAAINRSIIVKVKAAEKEGRG